MNIYYEIADACVDRLGGKYLAQYNLTHDRQILLNVLRMANIAWLEDDSGVRLVKNRFGGLSGEIDESKFFWIKLRSVTVR